ncbi:lytic transglycosylase domain-containing protein [Myxococcus sp. K38C18041901]|uniref:lytic transglycosylase domain-containing protein n=1 Tax=Myxococcus guangdongensis TaxID=2906760 RepID=UPI0020A7B066|nr:lytic transglycosylase domain-containing protein [Myxococcus guangdongensis]MCP3064550.1 lytic transglycosylase domain-containing protein [Myxococcus guangdongensis]
MRAIPALMLCAVLGLPSWAGASESIYRYVEKDGTIVYTNVPPTGSKGAKKMKGAFTPPPAKSRPVVGRSRTPPDLDPHIAAAAVRYRIPTALVRAIMHAESNFNKNALSHKGASGLMQLMPGTASDMYVKDIFDERDNIEGGVRYLRVLANMFDGDMVKMIAAYNAGPDAVKRYGGKVPPYEETQGYVRKVLQLYYHYKERERPAESGPRELTSQNDDAREGAAGDEPR